MNMRLIDIHKLNMAEYNPRKDLQPGDPKYEKLKRSIEEFGIVEPIVWNENTGNVVGGHQRLKVMKELGHKDADCVVVELDEPKEKALNLALNKISGDWDDELLAILLEDLQSFDIDMNITGFDDDEISVLLDASILDETMQDKGEIDNKFVENVLESDRRTKQGDIWKLGRHKLLVGNCTNNKHVAALFDGESPQILLTDPPYSSGGFQESGRSAGSLTGLKNGVTIKNDNLSTRGYKALMTEALRACNCAISYIFTDWRMWINLYDVCEAQGLAIRNMLVWDKLYPGMGFGWRTQHELIMFASKVKNEFDNNAPAQGNVIQVKRSGNILHATQKPLELIEIILSNSDWLQGVYDPFGGSGTTLIASEKLGQACYTVELDEGYADVILSRWEEMTGKKAELVNNLLD